MSQTTPPTPHARTPTPAPARVEPGRASWHLWALILLVPAPTIGVTTAMFLAPGTTLGIATQIAMKLWILILPLLWVLFILKARPHLPAFRGRGMAAGLITGVLTFAVIVGMWELAASRWINTAVFAEKIASIGLSTPLRFLLFAAAITVFNALMEEYVWRWFVYERFRDALRALIGNRTWWRKLPGAGAVVLAALCFTLHHTVAMSLYFDPLTNALASTGVFIGGVTWSTIYLKTKNIYAGYVSHIFADIALFYVGYQIAFG